MATHSTTLAWRIPWMEEPHGLQSMGSLRVGHDWATSLSLFTFMYWRRKWQPTPVFLPGESQGQRSLLGCLPSMGSHRVGHDWSDLAAVAAANKWTEFWNMFINQVNWLQITISIKICQSEALSKLKCFLLEIWSLDLTHWKHNPHPSQKYISFAFQKNQFKVVFSSLWH